MATDPNSPECNDCSIGDQVISMRTADFGIAQANGNLIPSATYALSNGESYIALSDSTYVLLGNTAVPTPSNLQCVDVVMDLPAGVPTVVPHGFLSEVCSYKAYDSLGNAITLGYSYNNGSKLLTACSTVGINNILIKVTGD